jgi:transcriptional regulator with XRE-family HTH domain
VRQKTRAGALFGERMREIRSKRGLTQQAVAERSDIPQTHVSDIELGFKLPNLLTVIRIAVALDCQVAELTSALDKGELRSLLPKA